MKTKVLILDSDTEYLEKMTSLITERYYENAEVYACSEYESARTSLVENDIDVFLADTSFEIVKRAVPRKCAFSYLSESKDCTEWKGQAAFCKYIKVSDMYEAIISLHSGHQFVPETDGKVILFASVGGGTGSSTAAVSCANYFAGKGKKVIYLNFEKFSSESSFFDVQSSITTKDISDEAVICGEVEMITRIDENTAVTENGVSLISSPYFKDNLKLTTYDFETVIKTVLAMKDYEYVIADCDFDLSDDCLNFYHHYDQIVLVSSGSEIANNRIISAYHYIDDSEYKDILNKTCILYNRFDNIQGTIIDADNIKNIGGIPQYTDKTIKEIVSEISGMGVFDVLE